MTQFPTSDSAELSALAEPWSPTVLMPSFDEDLGATATTTKPPQMAPALFTMTTMTNTEVPAMTTASLPSMSTSLQASTSGSSMSGSKFADLALSVNANAATSSTAAATQEPDRVFYDGCMRSTTNMFVAGLPKDFDDARLKALFAGFGEIVSSKIIVDVDTGVSKGIGFVRYTHPTGARKAIDTMNGKKLSSNSGRPLFLTLALDDGDTGPQPCERVYIRNVPPHVKEPELREAFAQFGEIVEARVLQGVAFVKYTSVEQASRAVSQAQGTRPFGPGSRPVMVRFAESQEARQHRHTRVPPVIPGRSPKARSPTDQQRTSPAPSQRGSHQTKQQPQQQPSPPTTPTPAVVQVPVAVPSVPSASFVWVDPSSGWVFTTTATCPSSAVPAPIVPQAGSGPRVIQSMNPYGLQLPEQVTALAPGYVLGAAPSCELAGGEEPMN